jgi:DNA processing protein
VTKNELIASLRLQNVPNIGAITAKKLIDFCGSPIAVFSDKVNALTKIEGIGRWTLKGLHDQEHQEAAEEEYEFISQNSIDCSYFKDSDYPAYLKQCQDAPFLIFSKGNIDIKHKKIISVVGTRNITSYGTAFCDEFIAALAPLDPVIVSGYAYGVDICIHRAALKYNLQTIGCLAHGLNQVYPKTHERYNAEVMRHGGFMTEFWSSSNPDRENFLKRNRVIAGISEATVVIESAEKGGSLVTADIANSYNRDVFAVPGRASDKFSVGCNNLIKQQKAHLLTSAADLIYLLDWDIKEKKSGFQQELFTDLNEMEKAIYSYLRKDGKQLIDHIALECRLPVFKASSTLLNMEMKGVIRPLPGKIFEAI